MLELEVYHGCKNHEDKNDNVVFFSSEKSFSEDYGEVEVYVLTLSLPFDTSSRVHINELLESVPVLEDFYTGETFYNFEELQTTGVLYQDTWEIFEHLIPQVQFLGYDGMIIYEGGVENFISFYSRQYKRLIAS
ncbi:MULTISPECIES: hypothetical protein [unclassified Psychrobacillus]|uniref:hypothetical protein n=1 Tax=unclassified Psychrobacillus TaxID=2636677 RepID=UPI0030FA14EE